MPRTTRVARADAALAERIERSCQEMSTVCALLSTTLDATPPHQMTPRLAQEQLGAVAVLLGRSIQDYATLRGQITSEGQVASCQLRVLLGDLARAEATATLAEAEQRTLLLHGVRRALQGVTLLRWATAY